MGKAGAASTHSLPPSTPVCQRAPSRAVHGSDLQSSDGGGGDAAGSGSQAPPHLCPVLTGLLFPLPPGLHFPQRTPGRQARRHQQGQNGHSVCVVLRLLAQAPTAALSSCSLIPPIKGEIGATGDESQVRRRRTIAAQLALVSCSPLVGPGAHFLSCHHIEVTLCIPPACCWDLWTEALPLTSAQCHLQSKLLAL